MSKRTARLLTYITLSIVAILLVIRITSNIDDVKYQKEKELYNNTIKKKDSIIDSLSNKIIFLESSVVNIQESRDSIRKEILKTRIENVLLKKEYEKVVNSIDTFDISELQEYFSKRYSR